MKIRLKVGRIPVITATLIDSKTTQNFISLLPLTLTLEDYAGTEKISALPKKIIHRGRAFGAVILLSTRTITLPGEMWRYFIEILGTQADLLSWER